MKSLHFRTIRKLSLVIILFIISANTFAQSAPPAGWPIVDNKLGIKVVGSDGLDMSERIPVSVAYENRTISYVPVVNTVSNENNGRKYYITIKTPEKQVTSDINVTKEHYKNILTNEEWENDLSQPGLGYLAYSDNVNNDCNFNLRNLYTEERTNARGTTIRFIKPFFNGTDNCIELKVYPINTTFEYKNNGNIETFNIASYKGGKNSFGFIAKSTYTKKRYLFIYEMKMGKIKMYDLSTLNITNNSLYNINDCTIKNILADDYAEIYVFLQFGSNVLPVMTYATNSIAKPFETAGIKLGTYNETKFKGYSGNVYSLWDNFGIESKGFVNAYSDDEDATNPNYKIKLYDKNFTFLWDSNLSGIRIMDIRESNGFLIIGGFTMTKGFVGFPNPRIVVINKTTKEITYDNVIPLKYGTVSKISSDEKGNIEVTASTWEGNYKTVLVANQIIFDILSSKGKFRNNLYQPYPDEK